MMMMISFRKGRESFCALLVLALFLVRNHSSPIPSSSSIPSIPVGGHQKSSSNPLAAVRNAHVHPLPSIAGNHK
jgi:hypothetical protein